MVETEKLVPNPKNPNQHPEAQIDLLAKIIAAHGWRAPITVSNRSGFVVRGHGRLLAAQKLGLTECPVDFQDYDTEAEEWADLIADNRLAELAVMDNAALASLLDELSQTEGFDATLAGFTAEQIDAMLAAQAEDAPEDRQEAARTLAERFLIPPFSILDARVAVWTERKAAWKRLGLRSEIGRGNDGDKTTRGLTFAVSSQPITAYKAKNEVERDLGQKMSWAEFAKLFPEEIKQLGTSIFDPVLCEVAYRWFCPPGGRVLDPFAGGSVRGVVAAFLGRAYFGVDLSARQVEANHQNWAEVAPALPDGLPAPSWHVGNSLHIQDFAGEGGYDFLFSCPPYADLEKYSDDPGDLSNKPYPEFLRLYREIIARSAALLAPDRFAAFLVGEVRGKSGGYYNFVGDTVKAFTDAGLTYYNEAILIPAAGSLAVRVGKYFSNSRKLGKTHQNVLIFVKGNPKKAVEALGDIDMAEIFGGFEDEN
jgi:hypothetical protein